MNKILLFAFASLIYINTQAQGSKGITVKGSAIDSISNSPVQLVTVGLYASGNLSAPIQNVLTNSKGVFEFKNIQPGKYVIYFTHLSYNESELNLVVTDTIQNITLPAAQLVFLSKELKSITVKAIKKKPLVIQEEDKLVYNTEADPSNQSINALDLLRKTPLISVDGEDNILLNGQTNFKILLNGKETGMFSTDPKNVLKGFPAKLVIRIEVITNPSSKYDAEGTGGIINIITKKKIVGYNGYAGVNLNRLNTIPFLGLNLKYGKFGFAATGGYNAGKTPTASSIVVFNAVNTTAFLKRIADGKQESRNLNSWGNIELSYDLDSLSSISVYGGGTTGENKTSRFSSFDLVLPTIVDTIKSVFDYYNKSLYPSLNWGIDYNHKGRVNKEKELTLKYFGQYSKNNSYDTSGQFSSLQNIFAINDNRAKDLQNTFEANYIIPIKNGKKIEMGIKAIFRSADADYRNYSRNQNNTDYTLNPANSDLFNYRQNVFSFYSTYRFKWKKMSFRIGGRLEQTDVDGDFRKSSLAVKQKYLNFFPNIFISKQLKRGRSISFTYSKRLLRPYISHLNPFINNVDTLNLISGNPGLNPQISHGLEAAFTIVKNQTSISMRLSQSFSNSQILRYTTFNQLTGVRRTTYENIGISAITSLSGNVNTKISPKWYFNLNATLQYVSAKNKNDRSQSNSGIAGTGSISTGYNFAPWFTLSTFLFYTQQPVTIQSKFGANYTTTFNASLNLLKDKLTISATASNPIPNYFSYKVESEDSNFYVVSNTKYRRSAFGISINWSFGKLSENVSRKKGIKNDDLKEKDSN